MYFAFWVTYNNLYKHNIMAVAFETVNVILTEDMKSSKFFLSLNLKATLGLLSRITWEEREDVTAGSRMKTGSWILLSILI